MERLRKRWEEFQLKVRKFVNYNWNNDPDGDVFRSLDILFVLGAIRYKTIQKWRRRCWNAYRVVTVFSFSYFVLNLSHEIRGRFDMTTALWQALVVIAAALCFVKDSILVKQYEPLQTVRHFVNSKPVGSGDTRNDSAYRLKFFRQLQLSALVFFTIQLIDYVLFFVPNSGLNELFGRPGLERQLGPTTADGIHFVFILTFCPIWFNKYCASTGTICALLCGFKTEYEIFVRGFGNILNNVYSDVEEMLPEDLMAAPDCKNYQRDELFWMLLKQRITDQVKLHIQLAENLQLLQPVVKYLFAIVYYNAMVGFCPMIYIVLFTDLSLTSLFLVTVIAINMLECYTWCSIINSYQDINETLENHIMDLITTIPHSQQRHKEFTDIRTTLFIMKTFVRNDEKFSCGGVFPITVEAFTELLNIGYTVVTFLRDVGNNRAERLKINHRAKRTTRKFVN